MDDISNFVARYKELGYQPLPSRLDAKRPMCRFADYWEAKAPDDLFERFPTSNVQIMCGRYWKLLVIDLDGPEAVAKWKTFPRTPRTWITHSGGGGQHWWFSLPNSCSIPMPKAFLWRGEDKHSAIERLCDKSLVVAPPSIHPETGKRYQFWGKSNSLQVIGKPPLAPQWLLDLKPIEPPKPVYVPSPAVEPIQVDRNGTIRFDREHVIRSIPDKVGMARTWGLRIAGRKTQKGWQPCHAVGRKDERPSAALHAESGCYVDQGTGTKMGFFDLGVALGVYQNWQDAIQDLGRKHAIGY